MVRTFIIVFTAVWLFGCSAANTETAKDDLTPETFLTLNGPCYQPSKLQTILIREKFNLVATANSLNGAGVKASVLFYRSSDKLIVLLQSAGRACVMVTGDKLSFGF